MKIKLQFSRSEKTLTLATIWSLVLTFSLLVFAGALIYKAAPSNVAIRIPTSKLSDGVRTVGVRALSADSTHQTLYTGTTTAEVNEGILTSIWQPPEELAKKNFIIEVCIDVKGFAADKCFTQERAKSSSFSRSEGYVAGATSENGSLTSCPYYVSSTKTRKLASLLGLNDVDLESRVYCPQNVTGAEEFAPYSRTDVIKATSGNGLGYLNGVVVAKDGVLTSISYQDLVNKLDVKTSTQVITNQFIVGGTGSTGQSLQLSGQVLSLSGGNSVTLPIPDYPLASSSETGLLSSTDWNTFSSKENSLSFDSSFVRTGDSVSLMSCAANEVIKSNGTSWLCAQDIVGTPGSTYSAGTGLSLVGTTFNNTGVLSVGASGALTSSGGQNPAITLSTTSDLTQLGSQLGLSSTGVSAGTYNNVTVDARGRVVVGTNISYLTTEQDGVVGNEVAGVVTGGGLVMAGAGTSGDPYRLGLITTCASGQVMKWNGSIWACANDIDTDTNTDQQTLSFNPGTGDLSLTNGGTVNLSALNTDSQTLSVSGSGLLRQLSVSGGNTVGLADSDNQSLSLASNTLSLSSGGSVNLAPYLDNTDSQSLSIAGNVISLTNSGSITLPADQNTTYSGGNGLSLTGTVFAINAPTCAGTTKLQWNGSAFVCATDVDTDTDAQTLSWNGGTRTLSILSGNSVVISDADTTYSAGTGITLAGTTFSLTNDFGTSIDSSEITNGTIAAADLANSGASAGTYGDSGVNVAQLTVNSQGQVTAVSNRALPTANTTTSGILSSADWNAFNGKENVLTFADGLNRTGNNVSLMDCAASQIVQRNVGDTAWVCANQVVDTNTTYSAGSGISLVGTTFSNNGVLSVTASGALTSSGGQNPAITLGTSSDFSQLANQLSLTATGVGAGTYNNVTVDAQGRVTSGSNISYLTSETDGVIGNEVADVVVNGGLVMTGAGTSGSPYRVGLITTCADNQLLKYTAAGGWACASDVDTDTNTDAQTLTWNTGTNNLSISGGNSVNLSSLLDNTDSQALGWNGGTRTLSLTSGGSVVIGDTDTTYSAGDGLGLTGTVFAINAPTCAGTTKLQWNGSAFICATDVDTDTDAQTLSWNGGTRTLSILNGNSAVISDADTTYSAGTGITLTGTTFSLTNDFGSSIDSSEITNGTIAAADLANSGATAGTYGDTGVNVTQLTVNAQGQVTAVSNRALPSANTTTTGVLSSSDWDTFNGKENVLTFTGNGLFSRAGNTITAIAGTVGGQVLKWNGSAWVAGTDNDTTYTSGSGLSLASTTFSINSPTCAGTTKLQWNGSAFVCSADVDTDTDTTNFNIRANAGASANIASGNTVSFVDGTGTTASRSTNDLSFSLTNVGTAGTYGSATSVPVITTDAQGRVTGVTSTPINFPAEVDGEVGNEVTNATANGGLTRSGSGTGGSPYTLGLLTTCTDQQVLKYTLGTTTWGCANDIDTNTTYSAGTGVTLTGTTFSLTNDFGSSIDSSEITNGAVAAADLANSGATAGTYGDTGVNVAQLTVNSQGQVTSVSNRALPTANTTTSGILSSSDWNTFNGKENILTFNDGLSRSTNTVSLMDCAASEILQRNVGDTAWACATQVVDTNTTYSAGTGITLMGTTFSLTNDFGSSIDSSEITNGTIAAADLANSGAAAGTYGDSGVNVAQLTVNAQGQVTAVSNRALPTANTTTSGILSSGDWNTFNGKENVLTFTGNGLFSRAGNTITGIAGTVGGQVLKWNGSAWVAGTDNDTTYTNGNGLSLASTTFSINAPTCAGTTKLQWNGSAFSCAADVDTDTDTTNFNIRANAAASANIASGNTISFVDGTGTTASRSTNDISFNLTNVGTAGTYGSATSVPVITTDAQGRVTGVTDTPISFPAEADGVIGNEVTNATTNGGLTRSGGGTGGSPYTLGLLTTCSDQQVLKYTLGTTTWGCANDTDTNTTYTNGTGLSLVGTTFSLTNDFGSSIDSSEITNATIAAADLANSGATAGTYGDSGVNVTQLTVNAQGQVTAVSNRALPTATAGTSGILSSADWNTFNGKENVLTFTGNGLFSRTGDTITAIAGTVSGQVLKWNGSAWVAGTDTDTDTTYTNGNGLSLVSTTFSINAPTCAGTTKLQWDGSAFLCSADVDTDTDTTNFNIRANAGASANIASGNTISFVDGTGTSASRSTNDVSFSLTNVGTAGTYGNATTVPVITTDAQGRVTGVTNTAITFPPEADGVVGNEVLDATTNGGLARSGSGTGGSPYTLGLLTSCGNQQVLKYTLGTTTWGCENDSDTTYTNGTGLSLSTGTFSITNTGVSANSYAPANNANGSLALPQFTVNAQGQLTAASTTNITLTGIANSQLANNSLTVAAGNGLLNGGSVALGGTTTLNIGAGAGITVNTDDITLDLTVATDALSVTTSSGSGLEVLASGLTLLQGCSDGQLLKWVEGTDIWNCATDNAGGVSDGDKGDLTVASSGTVWTIDADSVALGADTTGDYVANVVAGDGLTQSGSAGEGWTPTLNIGAGTGITVAADSVSLNCAATGASGIAFCQGGNSFGQAAIIGTNDANTLSFETGGTTRFTIDSASNTLTGNGVTTFTTTAGNALTVESGTTGAINIGTGANAKTITIGNATGATGLVLTSGTAGITGSTTASTTDGISFSANSVTTATGLKLSTTGLTTGNALQVVGPTEAGLSTNNILRVKNEDTFGFNKAQVIIGSGDTNNPEGMARDQLFVFGRINSSWNSFTQDFLNFQSNVAADGNYQNGFYDESAGTGGTTPSGQVQMQNVTGLSGIARLTFTGTLGTGPWASNWGTGGNLVTERSLNPVFEARVQASANTDVRHVVGFTDLALNGTINANTNNSANEAFFRKRATGTNWEAVTRSASGAEDVTTLATACSGGSACTTTAMRRLRVEVTNTGANGTVYFYIDGTLVATHNTAAVPASATRLGWLLAVTPTTTTYTGRVLDMDYVRVWSDDPPETAPETVLSSQVAETMASGESEAVASTTPSEDEERLGLVTTLNESLPGVVMADTGDIDQLQLASQLLAKLNDQNVRLEAIEDRLATLEASSEGLRDAVWSGGIVTSDTTFNGLVSFAQQVNFSGDNIGTLVVPAGSTRVQVTLPSSLSAIPKITTGKQSFISGDWRVTDVTQNGFVLELQVAQPSDTTFDWHAFALSR